MGPLNLYFIVSNSFIFFILQFPQELVTYGGNGQVFSNWAQVSLQSFLVTMNCKESQQMKPPPFVWFVWFCVNAVPTGDAVPEWDDRGANSGHVQRTSPGPLPQPAFLAPRHHHQWHGNCTAHSLSAESDAPIILLTVVFLSPSGYSKLLLQRTVWKDVCSWCVDVSLNCLWIVRLFFSPSFECVGSFNLIVLIYSVHFSGMVKWQQAATAILDLKGLFMAQWFIQNTLNHIMTAILYLQFATFIRVMHIFFKCSWLCWMQAGGTWALVTWAAASLWPLAWGAWVEPRLKLPSSLVALEWLQRSVGIWSFSHQYSLLPMWYFIIIIIWHLILCRWMRLHLERDTSKAG